VKIEPIVCFRNFVGLCENSGGIGGSRRVLLSLLCDLQRFEYFSLLLFSSISSGQKLKVLKLIIELRIRSGKLLLTGWIHSDESDFRLENCHEQPHKR
jgi:hypothetical protein